jgi:hypothetical protein
LKPDLFSDPTVEISVVDPDWIRIKEVKITHKNINSQKISFFKCWMFSCTLEGLYEGLGISEMQFLNKKRFKKFSSLFFFFNFWSSKALDPDPDSLKMLESDPNSLIEIRKKLLIGFCDENHVCSILSFMFALYRNGWEWVFDLLRPKSKSP